MSEAVGGLIQIGKGLQQPLCVGMLQGVVCSIDRAVFTALPPYITTTESQISATICQIMRD
ncbi:MAG: hypothetical protein U0559_05330 [Anaerolineae bacterium]